jgi:hypothetical protein
VPTVLLVFAGAIVAVIIVAIFIPFLIKKNLYFSIALASIQVIVGVVSSTFAKSLIVEFAGRLGNVDFKGKVEDNTVDVWGSVVIIGIMAFVAITMMMMNYHLEKRR